MEFAIASGYASEAISRSLKRHTRSHLDNIPLSLSTDRLSFHALGCKHSMASSRGLKFLFDGQFPFKNEYFHGTFTRGDLAAVHQELLRHGSLATGVFCFLAVEQQQSDLLSINLWTDWFGNYPVYIDEQQGKLIISSNLSVVESIGGASRSVWPAVENMLTGGLCDTSTHLQGVRRLPAYCSLSIDTKGSVKISRQADSLPGKHQTYPEAFDAFRQTLNDHVIASLNSVEQAGQDGYILSDLTGGCDSRSVLSALLGRVSPARIHIRALGSLPNPDFNVACLISNRLGLSRGSYPVIDWPQDYSVRLNAALSGGGRESGGALCQIGFSNLLHFRGSYGEVCGGIPFFDSLAKARSAGLGIHEGCQMLVEQRRRSSVINLLSQGALDQAARNLEDYFLALKDEGYADEDLFFERYLRCRSRTHFGLGSYIEGKWRILPDLLANKWLCLAGKSLPYGYSPGKKALFDLIRQSNHPDLAFWPMAKSRWVGVAMSEQEGASHELMQVVDRNSEPLCAETGPLHDNCDIPCVDPEDYRPLCEIAAPHSHSGPQLANLVRHRTVARHLFERTDEKDDVWQCFDRDRLHHELYIKSDEDFRPDGADVNPLGNFCSALTWLHGLEVMPSIQKIGVFPPT